jgi:hypothetical protein
MPRETADTVALILAIVVAIVIIATTVALLYIALTGSDQDTSYASDAISRFVSVIIAALVGYMAGRRASQ